MCRWLRQPMLLSKAVCVALGAAVFLGIATSSPAETPGQERAVPPASRDATRAPRHPVAPAAQTAESGAPAASTPAGDTEAAGAYRRRVSDVIQDEVREDEDSAGVMSRQEQFRHAPAKPRADLATRARATATPGSSPPTAVADPGAAAATGSWSEPELSLLRGAASGPAAVVEHWAGTVRIEVHFLPESGEVARQIGNVPGTRDDDRGHFVKPGLDLTTPQATDAAPEGKQSGTGDALDRASRTPPEDGGQETPALARGAADHVAANDPRAPDAGGSAAGETLQPEALNEMTPVGPKINAQRTGGWTQVVLALGLVLMAAGFGAHLAWTRFTRRSPRRVAFWDD